MDRADDTLEVVPSVGTLTLIVATVVGSLLGAYAALRSLTVATQLSGYAWRAARYRNWDLQFYDAFLAMLMGAALFGRLAQIGNGLIFRLFGCRAPLGGFRRWDALVIGLPTVIWGYLAYLANFN